MSESYLQFLDNPTSENAKEVHKQARKDFKITQETASEIVGVSLQTYKGWHAKPSSVRYRQPHKVMWNLFLYELEARRLGADNLKDFFENK